MSASPQVWPRAAAAAVLLATAACGGGGGGGGADIPSPVVTSVDPSSGFSGHDVDVVITGDNFLISPDSSTILAWLDSTPLVKVTRDGADPVHKLHATVPAGMNAGAKTLKVQNAYGRTGSKAGAYTVMSTQGGVLVVTGVQVTPSEVNVGQSATVQAVVKNAGKAAVTGVVGVLPQSSSTPTGGAAAVKDGPAPASVASLAPGDSATFSWTVEATTAGQLGLDGNPVPLPLTVTASGQDTFSQEVTQSDPVSGNLAIALPAGLTATVVAGRATADVNQDVPVTFTVANGGTASANLTSLVPGVSLQLAGSGSGSASCKNVSPSPSIGSPVTVGARASRAFTWTCSATAAGTITVTGTASGKDANTGASLSATPATPDTAVIQTDAVLQPVVTIRGNPTTVNVGQTVTVDVTVTNGGTASAHVNKVTPTFTPSTTSCSVVTPDPPAALSGSGTVQFSWTCTPATTPTLTLGANVEGSDDNTSANLAATATTVSVTVQPPAALVAIPSASPNPVDTNQAINVSLQVVNGGGGQVDSPVVTVTVDPTSTAAASCGTPSALPASLAGNGGHATSTWTCTPTAAGTLQLSATVTGIDHNNPPNPVSYTAPFAVTVQTPASVAVTSFVVDRAKVDTNQDATLTLAVRNDGEADARVTITPTSTPAGPCPATPVVSDVVVSGGGGTLTNVTWKCRSASANTFQYSADIQVVDGNNASLITHVAPTAVQVVVQNPPALSAGLSLVRNLLDENQSVLVTLTVHNSGGGDAKVENVQPGFTNGSGTIASCDAAPKEPIGSGVTVPGNNGSVTFTWNCTGGTTPGTATLGATVSATDVNNGGGAPVTVPGLGVTVQTAPSLTASMGVNPTTATVGQSVTVTLTIGNSGTASASVTALTPSFPSMSCGAASRTPTFTAGPGTTTVTWTCAGSGPGVLSLGATVTANDANNPSLDVSPTVTPVDLTVQTAPSLTASLGVNPTSATVGQSVTVTLTIGNSGTASASVTALTPSFPSMSCGAASRTPTFTAGPGTTTVTWTCSPTTTPSISLGATVTAKDANNPSSDVSPSVTGTSLTVAEVPLTAGALGVTGSLTAGLADSITVSVLLTNPGTAGADVTVNPTPGGSSSPIACSGTSGPLAAGTSSEFTWTCAYDGSGTSGDIIPLGASISATDSITITGDVSPPPPADTSVTLN